MENQAACAQLSFSVSNTSFWSYLPSNNNCWVKTSNSGRKPHPIAVSGESACGKTGKPFFSLKHSLLFKSINGQEGSSLHQWQQPNRPPIVKTRVLSLPGRQHPNQVNWVWRLNSYPQVHRWRRRPWQERQKVFVLSHEKRTAPISCHWVHKW